MVTLSITAQDLFEFDTDHISRSYYDEIEELSENLSLNCNLIIENDEALNKVYSTVVICCSSVGSILVDSLSNEKTSIAKIYVEYEGKRYNFPLHSLNDCLLLSSKEDKFSIEICNEVSKLLLSRVKFEQVCIFDEVFVSKLLIDDLESLKRPRNFYLKTTKFNNEAVLKELHAFEAPNFISGLSASVMGQCELLNKPAICIISLLEPIYGKNEVTFEILNSVASILAKLESLSICKQKCIEALNVKSNPIKSFVNNPLYL